MNDFMVVILGLSINEVTVLQLMIFLLERIQNRFKEVNLSLVIYARLNIKR